MTLSALISQLGHTIGWASSAQLTAWIQDAIRTYSGRFPFVWVDEFDELATGTQSYDLPEQAGHNITAVLSVEYPAYQDPPTYLVYTNPQSFEPGTDTYTLIGIEDTPTPSTLTSPGIIKFGPTVASGETALITYTGQHQIPASNDDIITVPGSHLDIIIRYVHWQAAEFKLFEELETPYRNIELVEQLSSNAKRLAALYHETLLDAVTAVSGQSRIITWPLAGTGQEQIY